VGIAVPSLHLREEMWRRQIQFRTSRLRRSTARPFGLTGGDGPVMLGDESSSTGLIAEIRAARTHAPVTLDSISLLYGDCLDLSAPLVEVITRWDSGSHHTADDLPQFARELGRAARRDEAIAREDWKAIGGRWGEPAEGPFVPGSADIVVSGNRSQVPTVSYRHYLTLSFRAEDAAVTVVSRHPLPDLPCFDPVTSLEPFCSGWARFIEHRYWPRRPALRWL
jgi:hypothetical protein